MFKLSNSVRVKMLSSSNYLLVFDPRSGDTIALEYHDVNMAKKLLNKPHEQAFFESALNLAPLSFKRAFDLNIIEKV